jgi:galactokinase
MADINLIINAIKGGNYDDGLTTLYGSKPGVISRQKERWLNAINSFTSIFPGKNDVELFSTPGRTEVGGNHTDHNAGRVLAASVDLDVIAIVAKNDGKIIKVKSEGYPEDAVNLDEMTPKENEKYTSASLIRGVCSRMKDLGFEIGGFEAYTTSNVLKGSGLSSSAAFEVLIVTILNHLYNNGVVDDVLNAQIAQYAENNFFGKPCGLMDQTTCSVGGFVTIDFKDFENPIVEKVNFNFASSGFSMVIVDTGGNHADLNADYTALEHEMKEVARAFGGEVLREFSLEKVLGNIDFLRTKVNDRAILRAIHFYGDDDRVVQQVNALETNNFTRFMELIIESGYSSWMLCQNCYSHKLIEEQGLSVALAVSENILKGKGAWRVHGGGFAGTIQAFVPDNVIDTYLCAMRKIFGEKACHELIIRPVGSVKLNIVK